MGQKFNPGQNRGNYKTELCKYFASGNCPYTGKCSFAHGMAELKDKPNYNNSGGPHHHGNQMQPGNPMYFGNQGNQGNHQQQQYQQRGGYQPNQYMRQQQPPAPVMPQATFAFQQQSAPG